MSTDAGDWIPNDDSDNPSYWTYKNQIETPDSNDRSYEILRLKNGLRVVLVHDPTTDVAAVSMNVGVGYFSDPDDMPGMAHLCEHVILTGSQVGNKKDMNCWQYVMDRCHSINATTTESSTYYYFTIGNDYLGGKDGGAIGRFANLFKHPTFHVNDIASEVMTVESEYDESCQSDTRRLLQLFKSQAPPTHPWRKFDAGNSQTLTPTVKKGMDVDEERKKRLKDWWHKNYSPSIMGLAILGNQSLDELRKMALSHFSSLGHTSEATVSPYVADVPWSEDDEGNITFAKRIFDTSTLEVSFYLPRQDMLYESKPTTYISRFIANEGPGSLHSYLTKKRWILQLSSGTYDAARGFSFLSIVVTLTKSGLVNYESVLTAIYAYLYFLNQAVLRPSVHFSEFEQIQNNSFQYSVKEDSETHVIRLSEALLLPWPRERLLSGRKKIWKQEDDLVRSMLEPFLVPMAGKVTLSSNDFSAIKLDVSWNKEEWYGTEYIRRPLNPELFLGARAHEISHYMFLPDPNTSIPQHFGLVPQSKDFKGLEYPRYDGSSPISDLWFKQRFKQDDQLDLPKGYIGLYIRSSVARDSPRHSVMTKLIEWLLTDFLKEKFFDHLLAGRTLSVISDYDGTFILQVGGYTENMISFFKDVLQAIKAHNIQEGQLSIYRHRLKQNLKNSQLSQPCIVAHQSMEYMLRSVGWSPEELERAANESIPLSEMQQHLGNLLAPAFPSSPPVMVLIGQRPQMILPKNATVLVTGNFEEKDAQNVRDIVDGALPPANGKESRTKTNVIEAGKNFVYHQTVVNSKEKNNAVEYYLQIDDDSQARPMWRIPTPSEARARLLLLAHIMSEPTLNTLREIERLGYTVSCLPRTGVPPVGISVRVEGAESAPSIEASIDEFLKNYKLTLDTMSDDDFNTRRDALVKMLTQRLDNQDQEAVKFGAPILSGSYDFDLEEASADLIGDLTKGDVCEFYERYIVPSSKHRRKLSVHAVSPNPHSYDRLTDPKKFRA
ncbi:hypothetical protein M408DRAFT_223654 [Serendipita vermifera MAFF 305830]|uniref:Peptidase M16 N-terminal domain-containing protein n=1 Tax=Serendipita vermifera MAFF 305830 TaxID=933852 RepID=A0A0C3AYS8_SERVB|nr:hypothetical protein M408DRAFT_223654 [Serendipita vermifera MAFF 305830]